MSIVNNLLNNPVTNPVTSPLYQTFLNLMFDKVNPKSLQFSNSTTQRGTPMKRSRIPKPHKSVGSKLSKKIKSKTLTHMNPQGLIAAYFQNKLRQLNKRN